MAFSLIPDRVYPSIFDIDIEALAVSGVKLVLADLDNTLVPYGVAIATHEVRAWSRKLKDHGITLFVLSNNRSPIRAKRFSEDLGVPFLGRAGKPKPASFHSAMEQMGCTADQTVMLGDQLFTDVLGGKRAGVTTIAVKPVKWGKNPLRLVRYAVEVPFRAIGKRRTKLL